MHYDIGTLSLWIGVGVALIVGGIQAAGWRHRALIIGLVVLGAAMIVAALAVPPAADKWPAIARFMSDAATPSSWVMLILLVAGLILLGPRFKRDRKQQPPFGADLTQEALDAMSADISRRIESQGLSFKGSLESIWTEINAQRAAIVQIERRTTFPPNLGETFGEALISSENVRLSQIARIRDEVHTYDERLKWLGPDILRLLHFATLQATATAIEGLIAEAPNAIAPLDISEDTAGKLLAFVSRCEVVLMACGRYQAFRHIMQNSEIAVDGRLDNIPTPQYPPDVTPANYRKRIILQEQFKNLMDYQIRELRGLNEGIAGSRSDLIDRSNRTNS